MHHPAGLAYTTVKEGDRVGLGAALQCLPGTPENTPAFKASNDLWATGGFMPAHAHTHTHIHTHTHTHTHKILGILCEVLRRDGILRLPSIPCNFHLIFGCGIKRNATMQQAEAGAVLCHILAVLLLMQNCKHCEHLYIPCCSFRLHNMPKITHTHTHMQLSLSSGTAWWRLSPPSETCWMRHGPITRSSWMERRAQCNRRVYHDSFRSQILVTFGYSVG